MDLKHLLEGDKLALTVALVALCLLILAVEWYYGIAGCPLKEDRRCVCEYELAATEVAEQIKAKERMIHEAMQLIVKNQVKYQAINNDGSGEITTIEPLFGSMSHMYDKLDAIKRRCAVYLNR
jgi:hypothetical protein